MSTPRCELLGLAAAPARGDSWFELGGTSLQVMTSASHLASPHDVIAPHRTSQAAGMLERLDAAAAALAGPGRFAPRPCNTRSRCGARGERAMRLEFSGPLSRKRFAFGQPSQAL